MRPLVGLRRLTALILTAVALGACSDSTGPSRINPGALLQDLVAVDEALSSPAFQSLTAVSALIAPSGPAPSGAFGAVVRATLPMLPARSLRAGAPRALSRADRRTLVTLSVAGASTVPVIPPGALGKTFEWDATVNQYAPTTRTGAPITGVRFILYQIDTIIDLPVEPVVEVGLLDIIDRDPAVGASLQLVIRGVGGAPVYLDYTITLLPGTGAVTISATGFVGNGLSGGALRRLDFDAAITIAATPTGGTGSINVTYDVNIPDVRIELHFGTLEDTTSTTGKQVTAIDFQLTDRSQNIRLVSADTTFTAPTASEHGRLEITVNGALYATLATTDGVSVLTDRNGDIVPLDDPNDAYEEDDVLFVMILAFLQTVGSLDDLFAVPQNLLGFSISF